MNLTKSFAKELAPEILINCVVPGTIDTEMTRAGGEELIKWRFKFYNRIPFSSNGRYSLK
ncbi:MAG: hypothetical protein J7L08_00290 [Candidatus Aenigmarchaeota archaeon]|nr:hypothetical protein [Candidatus Aenigmarchaeota archaeon]